jgi:organic radical activating enzyme
MSAVGSLLSSYRNGGYLVSVYSDGTKVRREFDAAIPPTLPESADLKITNFCNAGCAWCHEKSTKAGKHGDMDAILRALEPLRPGAELAIGGGDPLAHPEFERLVTTLSARGIICSVTVNGKHFEQHRPILEKLTSEGKLYGVGYSYAGQLPDWDYPHLVIHLIAGVHAPEVLDAATRRFKVLILGYKQHGRGKKLFEVRQKEVQDSIKAWYRQLFLVAQEHNLSFDNLAIEQLKPQRLFAGDAMYNSRFMGEEGSFSMYIDGVTQTYAVSSYSTERKPWSNLVDMFKEVRASQGFVPA